MSYRSVRCPIRTDTHGNVWGIFIRACAALRDELRRVGGCPARADPSMIKRLTGSTIVAAALTGVFPLETPASGQSQPAVARRDTVPRTPDGQPDIQGFWQAVPIGTGAMRRRPERFSLEDI